MQFKKVHVLICTFSVVNDEWKTRISRGWNLNYGFIGQIGLTGGWGEILIENASQLHCAIQVVFRSYYNFTQGGFVDMFKCRSQIRNYILIHPAVRHIVENIS